VDLVVAVALNAVFLTRFGVLGIVPALEHLTMRFGGGLVLEQVLAGVAGHAAWIDPRLGPHDLRRRQTVLVGTVIVRHTVTRFTAHADGQVDVDEFLFLEVDVTDQAVGIVGLHDRLGSIRFGDLPLDVFAEGFLSDV